MEDIFNKLVEEFGLLVSVDRKGERYGKLSGYAGFLIALVPTHDYIMVAKEVAKTDNGDFFFFGANGFNDYEEAKSSVSEMILKAKEMNVNKKIQNIQKDFKCKRNFTQN